MSGEMGNAASAEDVATPTEERPAPPPKDGSWLPNAIPTFGFDLAADPAPASSPAPAPPRLKKKVPWKGKTIPVLLPWDDERGMAGKAPMPLQPKDVEAMLEKWEQSGYDTKGFSLGHENDYNGAYGTQGQSCGIWPAVNDLDQEREQRDFQVSIPDRKEWDAYVEELKEAKLRALGVSLGDDDPPPTISPAVATMSRQNSMQYPPLPFSPPIPTSSASSMHRQHPFSPALLVGAGLSTGQSSNPGSVASPASMHAHLQGKFNTRHQSVSFSPGEHPFGSPFQYPQPQSPGVWSPQQAIFQQGHARGGSPSMHNLGSIMSPSSPFSQDGGYFQNGDVMSQMQQRQQFLQNQLHHQQQLQMQSSARASPRLQDLREVDDEATTVPSKSPSKTPEARPIRHNPSASLQKEIDDAEYHLEEQMVRQLEHEDYSPHSDHGEKETRFAEPPVHARNPSVIKGGLGSSRFAISDDSDPGPTLHHPQPHSRGHSLSQQPFHDSEDTLSATDIKARFSGNLKGLSADASDLETNPSNIGTPLHSSNPSTNNHSRALSTISNPWAESEAAKNGQRRNGHSAKPSMSTLNVAAKEFKFNPASSFKPSQFSFGSNGFQPQQPVSAFPAFGLPASATSSHFSHPSIGSGKINVAAPVFTPGQSEFSFSTSGPTFRPDAPAFTPLSGGFGSSIGSVGSGSDVPQSTIFGNIDLNAINTNKASKKSKAIPIIRPDSSHSVETEDDGVEDKDGRMNRSEGRNKRARGGKDDGDSVPLFAEPSLPLGETSREQSPPKESPAALEKPTDKENSAPLASQDVSPITPDAGASHMFEHSAEQGNKEFSPYEFQQQKQAEDFNAARPFVSRRYGSGLPGYGFHAPSEDGEVSPVEEEIISRPASKGHKKNVSSLSATAKPFEFRPGAFNFTYAETSEPTPTMKSPPTLPKPNMGLSASRYARSPTPPAAIDSSDIGMRSPERSEFQAALPLETPPNDAEEEQSDAATHEATFEEIDAIMNHMNPNAIDTARASSPGWQQSSPTRGIQMPDMDASSPIRLQPQNLMRSDAPSPSPGRFMSVPGANGDGLFSHDPFVGDSLQTTMPFISPSPIHRLNRAGSVPQSDWDDVLSETEEAKLQPRSRFFDNHVNDLVGGLLAERIEPLERTLETIQVSIEMMAARAPSSRQERRSISGALSDADDEDDDIPRRSLSPQRRDQKLDKIKRIIIDALNTHQSSQTVTGAPQESESTDSRNVLQVLEEMREQFGQSMRLDLRGEDLRNVVEEAVERRMPATVNPAAIVDEAAITREVEQRARIAQLEEKLQIAETKPVIDQAAIVREAEYKAKIALLEERVLAAEARPLFDEAAAAREAEQKERIAELESRLRGADSNTETEIQNRRAAEDRLAEVQRLLRISSEEEDRLRESMEQREVKIREIVDERDQKVRSVEESRAKTTMRIALLEAGQSNAQKSQMDLQTRINITESELHQCRQELQHWQMEAERAVESARRHNEDAEQANDTNKELRRTIDTLRTQMEESIRVREGMRGKLMLLQEEMAHAARDISEDNARRAKKEQELVARQEVLDARLQAEARTRERLELEIERLENGEREGMRAVSDIKKLEVIVAELRQENHNAQKDAMRYQREFEEARESGLSEVQRTRKYMQAEIESANNQVNVVREDLENQVLRLRAEIDQVRLDADTAKEKHEMLLEEANTTKVSMAAELKQQHADAVDDMIAQHERQLGNAIEDAQRSEQHLLERLSLSSAKTEHLQDRVLHLEEKLEIANQAATAAAKAARTANISGPPASHSSNRRVSRGADLPEKISPQALRESIMVLQEQLQDREQTIEKLEAIVANVDPEAHTKISKRDDEIMWLRELLSVRKADLHDIVGALSTDQYDPEQVKDAAIRLSANLQMEEVERERAMNGGSAINLPNIAASLRDAASPRVAQAVGPLAAAWGNWRKSREPSASQPASRSSSSTPRQSNSPANSSFLSGLMTPPSTKSQLSNSRQPTAFGSTGQRFTSAQLANRPRVASRQELSKPHDTGSQRSSPRKERSSPRKPAMMSGGGGIPSTPPMMRKASYDMDARASEDFSDAGFYDDDESEVTVDESMYGGGRR
ncbi:hypothetical protein M7I_5100 [Glarea lozoyensis 74030]|nr:hypothetical protein M7I_5100 [Glarea lozoyensis 74030]